MSNSLQIIKNADIAPPTQINGRLITSEELSILRDINKVYAHVVIGGKHQIVSQIDCAINGVKLSFGRVDSFHYYFSHLSNVAGLNRGKAWIIWVGKAFFNNGIGFYPATRFLPKGCYNLFNGWHCKAQEGECFFIIKHITEILCNGNQEAARYFIQWLAHMFQYPEVKPTVAIFLKSVEGTGKGTLFRLLQKMLGIHTSQINGSELVTRNFNGILTAKLLIFADEVNLIDRDVFDKMKGLISEPTCQLEKKGLEAEPMKNLSRFMFASNHDQVIPAGKRERRFLLIEASSEKASDKNYWIEFNSLINTTYAGFFLNYLLTLDISDFDPFNAPLTKELIEQKILNFEHIDLYFHEKLNLFSPFNGERRISSTGAMNEFIQWIKDKEIQDSKYRNINVSSSRSLLSKKLKRLGFNRIGQRTDRNGGVFYDVPDIQKLKESFANEHGLTAYDLFYSINGTVK
ncbi:primase-helicase family protein [uncultured Psychromonas sp.]|uniref:primase-helicase family protein n=1 Tax=uncultured Psychromonas sp. TaxID=173974 RepID=UPI0026187276|nr:primase-helicase family protein [uncultured Psychromonas sp.]